MAMRGLSALEVTVNTEPTALQGVVETSLYGEDLEAMEAFYSSVLGLPVIDRDPVRHVFLRVGQASVLLLFRPETTLAHGVFPPHGAHGPGHAAFGIPADQVEPGGRACNGIRWRSRKKSTGLAAAIRCISAIRRGTRWN